MGWLWHFSKVQSLTDGVRRPPVLLHITSTMEQHNDILLQEIKLASHNTYYEESISQDFTHGQSNYGTTHTAMEPIIHLSDTTHKNDTTTNKELSKFDTKPTQKITNWIPLHHSNSPAAQVFGTHISTIDPLCTLRIIMQNTQFTFQLTDSKHRKLQAIENIHTMQLSIFIAISPNINWHNPSCWATFR